MLMIVVVLLIVFAVAGGGWGYSRYGWSGASPAGIVLAIVVVLYFTGNIHFH